MNDPPLGSLMPHDDGAPAQTLAAKMEGRDSCVAPFLHDQVLGNKWYARRPRYPQSRDDFSEGSD